MFGHSSTSWYENLKFVCLPCSFLYILLYLVMWTVTVDIEMFYYSFSGLKHLYCPQCPAITIPEVCIGVQSAFYHADVGSSRWPFQLVPSISGERYSLVCFFMVHCLVSGISFVFCLYKLIIVSLHYL